MSERGLELISECDVGDELDRLHDWAHVLYLAVVGAAHDGSGFRGLHADAMQTCANDLRICISNVKQSIELQRKSRAA